MTGGTDTIGTGTLYLGGGPASDQNLAARRGRVTRRVADVADVRSSSGKNWSREDGYEQ